MEKLPRKASSGQALLIVLLTMAVVLTVVLSVVSRSVTDISVTTYEEEAQRAFDAAEAGVERVLLEGTGGVGELGPARYEVQITDETPSGNQFVYPSSLNSGESATFWAVSHEDNGDLVCSPTDDQPCIYPSPVHFCWGDDNSRPAALEITVYYDETGLAVTSNNFANVKVKRYAYDSHPSSHPNNNFSTASVTNCAISGQNFVYSTDLINLNNDLPAGCGMGCILMAKVRVLYNSTPIYVGFSGGGGALPQQGNTVESVGTSGESTRKVKVFQGYSEIPFVFDAALFSPGGVNK